MLDTVLEIGRTLRDPNNRAKGLKHHRYVRQCPSGEGEEVLRLRIPVSESFEIDFDGITVIEDENVFDKLYYLRYKSSDADSLTKYIFGDIYYMQEKGKGVSPGYYRLGNPDSGAKAFQVSSYERGEDDAQQIASYELVELRQKNGERVASIIASFRQALRAFVSEGNAARDGQLNAIDLIERILRYQAGIRSLVEEGDAVTKSLLLDEETLEFATARRTFAEIESSRYSKQRFRGALGEEDPEWSEIEESREAIKALADYASGKIFLHFTIDGKHWYEYESAMKAIDRQFISKFAVAFSEKDFKGAVLKKYIYKTMFPGRQLPEFDSSNQHRVKLFDDEELMNLFYAIDTAKQAKFSTSSVKIVVLPKGENMAAEDITQFMERSDSLGEATKQERELKGKLEARKKQLAATDSLFDSILKAATGNIVQFDLVFSEADSRGQDADLVEISGVSKSFLQRVHHRIRAIKLRLYEQWEQECGTPLENDLQIQKAFYRLVSDFGQDKPKYERHLFQVLPKIYTETYYRDPVLLPALIERTEHAIRNDGLTKRQYNRKKFDFYLLTRIQNTEQEGENLMRITTSPSYELGLPLGIMARPLRSRINSFEKNYVGNLRRRIATLDDLIEFKNDIEEMLVRHEVARMTSVQEARQELADAIRTVEDGERLDKNECAFGFFETYFKPYSENGEDDTGE